MSDPGNVTVVDVLHDVTLLRIEQTELAAARGQEPAGEGEQPPEAEPTYKLEIDSRADDKAFRVGLRTEIQVGPGYITSALRAEYQLDQLTLSQITEPVRIEFANEVAIMAILPYTRQSIADITTRVFGAPLLMPIMKRGELSFDPPEKDRSDDSATA